MNTPETNINHMSLAFNRVAANFKAPSPTNATCLLDDGRIMPYQYILEEDGDVEKHINDFSARIPLEHLGKGRIYSMDGVVCDSPKPRRFNFFIRKNTATVSGDEDFFGKED